MSADNGIYILKTKDQYRVIQTQAVENLYWSFLDFNSQEELVPTRIVEHYSKSKYTYNQNTVRDIAFNMARRTPTEYGVNELIINKTWEQIVKEAKELAPLEIESIKKSPISSVWSYELSKLKEFVGMKGETN